MDFRGQFSNATDALTFMFAGDAKITIVSRASKKRYTFQIEKASQGERWFVRFLTAPDTYEYVGTIDGEKREFRLTAKSRLTAETVAVRAFDFAYGHLNQRKQIHKQVEIWHEGICSRCGITLTVPESIARGLGPVCAKKIDRMKCEAA